MNTQTAITDLILETFGLNGRLLAWGDALVADLGLTSARWQVLGAIALSQASLPVAHIARNMGLTRQAVRRLVNEMEADGLVRLAPNPHHQRARLVLLTERGQAAYDGAMQRYAPWTSTLAEGVRVKEIEAAVSVLRNVRRHLDNSAQREDDDA